MSLAMLLVVGAVVVGGTGAFFSDTETSTGNTFTAGAIDLQIDNESYFTNPLTGLLEFSTTTSWALADLTENHLFFDFHDLKPGDVGEDTISVHVNNNPAWACMGIDVTATPENDITEPEGEDGDVTDGADEGELQNFIHFVWWGDDGDNVLEEDEAVEGNVFGQQPLGDFNGFNVALADSTGNGILSDVPLDPTQTYYIGKAWCFGEFALDPIAQDGEGRTGTGVGDSTNGPLVRGTGITCDGGPTDNTSQTDSVEGTVSFTAIQARHNDDFVCEGGIGCLEKADVMIVLDQSGSIASAGATATVAAAAKGFIDALAPSADGVHVGLATFSTSAGLAAHLTDDGAAVKAIIDGLPAPSGGTDMAGGIVVADLELDNPGDAHDRDDVDSPDFIVLITDGVQTVAGDPVAAGNAAKADGIEIFVVGVGAGIDDVVLKEIASDPDASHYFEGDFAALESILDDLADCNLGDLIQAP